MKRPGGPEPERAHCKDMQRSSTRCVLGRALVSPKTSMFRRRIRLVCRSAVPGPVKIAAAARATRPVAGSRSSSGPAARVFARRPRSRRSTTAAVLGRRSRGPRRPCGTCGAVASRRPRRVRSCTPRASGDPPVTDPPAQRNRRWESAHRRERRQTGARETGWCWCAPVRLAPRGWRSRRGVAGGRARWV